METWRCKTLGDGAAATAPAHRIQQMFRPLFMASGRPCGMAVFSHYDRRAKRVTAYFSPGASKLAAFFDAKPCAKPAAEGIGLLVGDTRCWEVHFPDRKPKAA
jgi:hypothetical protein